MLEEKNKQALVAKKIVESATPEEQLELFSWAGDLLEIRHSNLSARRKATEALKLTCRRKVVWPLVKRSSKELKRVGWDQRSWKARLGIGAAVGTLVAVGNAGAGIAALGGAIGVPLWIVIGAGGTFAGVLIEEVATKRPKLKTSHSILEAEKELARKNDVDS